MKKNYFQLSLVAIGMLLSLNIFAQNHPDKCGASTIHNQLMNDPAYVQKMNEFELYVKTQSSSNTPKVAAQYRIPVVVHVLHKGEAVGVGTNVSDADIRAAIQELNNRYRKTAGTAGDGNGVDMEIEFALAVRDPNGACTNGITRVSMTSNTAYMNYGVKVNGSTGITDAQVKAAATWNKQKYYNIYLVSEIDDNGGGAGIQGYAVFASAHGTSQDGAVILASNFTAGGSMTTTHELGHALNLYHTFEGDGTGATCPSTTNGCGSGAGDCCADTPPHKRSQSDCNTTGTNSCNSNSSNTLFVRNYMDYSSDACMNMFTANQKTRALAACSGSRASFFATSNLALTPVAAPVADFSANSSLICSGQTVTFTDLSACVPNTYLPETNWTGITFSWTFTNGSTVLTSTLQNPTMTFTVAGAYDVTLTVTTAAGTNTITKPAYVVLVGSPTNACTPTSTNAGNYAQTISKVVFNTISNTTDDYTNVAYSNFTCTDNTIVQAGNTYNMSITGNAGPSGAEKFEVYIDYNNNGVFANPGELVHSGSIAAGTNTTVNTQTLSANVTIPATAVTNTVLRMRVIGEVASITAGKRACTSAFSIGDVEDYGIYIQSNCTSAPTISAQPTASTICANANTTFSVTSAGGTSYQWQVSTNGGTSWASVTGAVYTNATTATLTITGATATMNTYKYRCVITNGCGSTNSSEVVLTVNASPTITASTPANRCGTGTVTLSATASSGTLSWFAAATGGTALGTGASFTTPTISATTTYYVSSTASGCSSARTAVIATINPVPTVTSPGNKTACIGATVPAISFSGSSTSSTYAWTNTNTAIGLAASGNGNIASFAAASTGTSTISVTPTLNGCPGTAVTFTITVNALPSVTLGSLATVCNNASSFALSGGSPAGGTYSGTGVTNNNFNPASAGVGTFPITYTATQNGCSNTATSNIIVENCASIDEVLSKLIIIYPNPTSGLMTIKDIPLDKVSKMEMIDAAGRIVGKWNLNAELFNVDLSAYASGSYNLKFSGNDVQLLKRIEIKK